MTKQSNVGALIIRIGFWGPFYYNYNKGPPITIGDYLRPYIISQIALGLTILILFRRNNLLSSLVYLGFTLSQLACPSLFGV